jgi:hypothetical protein
MVNEMQHTPGYLIAKTWKIIRSCKTAEQLAVAIKFKQFAQHELSRHVDGKLLSIHTVFFHDAIAEMAFQLVLEDN